MSPLCPEWRMLSPLCRLPPCPRTPIVSTSGSVRRLIDG
ncbi:hypothetical protein GFS60_05889 [Rhodococcus sp. WAY2]|nr:hypothetical protein GFS60_05889 [Rhodococcus sp. WAY2]